MTKAPEAPEDRTGWHGLLDKAADEALERWDNNIHLASKTMQAAVRADPRLSKAVFEILVAEACTDRIRRRLQIKNNAIWHNKEPFDATMRGARLRSAAELSREYRLMEYSLRGGLMLGDATRKQVRENAEMQDKQARRMAQTALWLALIADRMHGKRGETVSSVLTELELRELQKLVLDSMTSPPKTKGEDEDAEEETVPAASEPSEDS
jgi:hypothetical protein